MPNNFEDEAMMLLRPVFLIGFMGAGKTSVARKLARWCKISAVDTDTFLERREEKSVAEIFAEQGEAAFRALETEILRELACAPDPLLISCGGGIITSEENREIMASCGFTVLLYVNFKSAVQRIEDTSSRPLLQDPDAAQKRFEDRSALYESAADAIVNTVGKSVPSVARSLQHLLVREGVLCPAEGSVSSRQVDVSGNKL